MLTYAAFFRVLTSLIVLLGVMYEKLEHAIKNNVPRT
jgi:hypothetical protein